MTRTTAITAYADIVPVLNKARQLGGASLQFEDFRTAVKWRARAYRFRKLYREQEFLRLGAIPGMAVPTPWDDMLIKLDIPNRGTEVTVEFGVKTNMVMRPLNSPDAPPVDMLPVPGEDVVLSENDIIAQATKLMMDEK